MTVESQKEIEALKAIGRIAALALKEMAKNLRPGITTRELDDIGRIILEEHGARSAPQLIYRFPGATCISIGEQAAHGIPGDTVLKAGQMVNLDVSAEKDGYFADTGASFVIPPASAEAVKMLAATKSALWKAIHVARAGQPMNGIGRAIESEARQRGFHLVRDLTGHGVGRSLHEDPEAVLNYYNPRDQRVIHQGMVFTIEPFLTTGSGRIRTEQNGWTLSTSDRSPVAQFEHTLIAMQGEPIITTIG